MEEVCDDETSSLWGIPEQTYSHEYLSPSLNIRTYDCGVQPHSSFSVEEVCDCCNLLLLRDSRTNFLTWIPYSKSRHYTKFIILEFINIAPPPWRKFVIESTSSPWGHWEQTYSHEYLNSKPKSTSLAFLEFRNTSREDACDRCNLLSLRASKNKLKVTHMNTSLQVWEYKLSMELEFRNTTAPPWRTPFVFRMQPPHPEGFQNKTYLNINTELLQAFVNELGIVEFRDRRQHWVKLGTACEQ